MSGGCAHCGLPVADALPAWAEEPRFCCRGCAVAWSTLQEAGLGDYYRLRSTLPDGPVQADPEVDAELNALADPDLVARLVADPARPQVHLRIGGLHCASCAWVVEEVVGQLPGVRSIHVRVPAERAVVLLDPDGSTGPVLQSIVRRLRDAGYSAVPVQPGAVTAAPRRRRADVLRLGISAALAANIMLIAVSLYGGDAFGMEARHEQLFRWLSLALAVPLVAYGGAPFLRRAASGLRAGVVHVDLPIAVALVLVFGSSAAATVRGSGPVWFDSLAMLILLLLVGRHLEGSVRAGVQARMTSLVAGRELRVRRLEDGAGVLVPARRVHVGDLVELRPGDVSALDVRVVEGRSELDLGVSDGEARPRPAAMGSVVPAGARVLNGRLIGKVLREVDDGQLGWVRQQIDDALARRTPVELLADRVARSFVVAVLFVGAAAWIGWRLAAPDRALEVTAAVLVVACPCALALATPLAFAAAVHGAVRAGVLLRSGDVLLRLTRTTKVVFDKTGTLTLAEPRMGPLRRVGTGMGVADALRLAGGACQASLHPVARALTRRAICDARGRLPFALDVVEEAGEGLSALVEGHSVRVIGPGVRIEIDGELAAEAELVDVVRPGAQRAIASLKSRGLAVTVLSGDVPGRVGRLADAVQADDWIAAARPDDKVAAVERWQANGQRVVFVGDGLNDAAALAVADVGIAIGGGADLSLEAADGALVDEGAEALVQVVELGHRLRRTLRRGVAWSLLYNTVAVAAAAAGLVTPLLAAVLMPLSSIVVIVAAGRLART